MGGRGQEEGGGRVWKLTIGWGVRRHCRGTCVGALEGGGGGGIWKRDDEGRLCALWIAEFTAEEEEEEEEDDDGS